MFPRLLILLSLCAFSLSAGSISTRAYFDGSVYFYLMFEPEPDPETGLPWITPIDYSSSVYESFTNNEGSYHSEDSMSVWEIEYQSAGYGVWGTWSFSPMSGDAHVSTHGYGVDYSGFYDGSGKSSASIGMSMAETYIISGSGTHTVHFDAEAFSLFMGAECSISINGLSSECSSPFVIDFGKPFDLELSLYISSWGSGGNWESSSARYDFSSVRILSSSGSAGMQLYEPPSEVPEPSTLALTGIALLAVAARAKSKRLSSN